MNKVEFNEWANNMIKRVDYKRFFTYRLPDDSRTIICYDKKTGKMGVARCHSDDTFNLVWGKAIARARCSGFEVPKITEKKLSEMQYGDKFVDMSGFRYCFIAKHPFAINQYIILRIADNYTPSVCDGYYKMVE